MPLPMFDKKKDQGTQLMKPGRGSMEIASEMDAPSSGVDEGLKSAAEDLLMAIEKKSPIGVASALQAAYDICESQDYSEVEGQEE